MLSSSVRDADISGRRGEEEACSVLLQPHTDPDGASLAAEQRLQEMFAIALDAGGKSMHVSFSAGAARFDPAGGKAVAKLENIDQRIEPLFHMTDQGWCS